MTRSIWLDLSSKESNRKKLEFDVVVVGAGIMGSSAAYYLAKRKGLKVALIESNSVCSQTSSRNAGFVLRGIQTYYHECVKRFGREKAAYIYNFAEENQSLIREFASNSSLDIGLDDCGSYILADSIEELEELEESYELLKSDSFDVELFREDPLDRKYYGALLTQSDFGINPYLLTKALIDKGDAQLFENEHVLALHRSSRSDSVEVVGTSTSFVANTILMTTNAYSSLVDPWFENLYTTARGQILVTQPLDKHVLDRICYANYGWVYFRQLANGRFLLGGRRQLFMDQEVGYADMVTPNVQAALEEYMKDYFPDIVGVPIDYRFSGIMAYTKDGLPVLGEHPHFERVFYALGFNGHGLGYGLNMARLLVDHALDGASLEAFGSERPTLQVHESQVEQGP